MYDDFPKLDRWIALMRSGEAIGGEVTSKMAARAADLVTEGFATETDPYGHAWAPKRRPDGRKVLHGKTGRLAHFVAMPVGKHRFVLVPGADYGAFLQTGTGHMVARKMVPDLEHGLPDSWKAEFSKQAVTAMKKHFTR